METVVRVAVETVVVGGEWGGVGGVGVGRTSRLF